MVSMEAKYLDHQSSMLSSGSSSSGSSELPFFFFFFFSFSSSACGGAGPRVLHASLRPGHSLGPEQSGVPHLF